LVVVGFGLKCRVDTGASVVEAELLLGIRDVCLESGNMRLSLNAAIRQDSNSSQDSNDDNDDEELDDGETMSVRPRRGGAANS
jgi:hypothetical protein